MLKLHADELGILSRHIVDEYRLAHNNHAKRVQRWAGYYARWRQRIAPQAPEDAGRPTGSRSHGPGVCS